VIRRGGKPLLSEERKTQGGGRGVHARPVVLPWHGHVGGGGREKGGAPLGPRLNAQAADRTGL